MFGFGVCGIPIAADDRFPKSRPERMRSELRFLKIELATLLYYYKFTRSVITLNEVVYVHSLLTSNEMSVQPNTCQKSNRRDPSF